MGIKKRKDAMKHIGLIAFDLDGTICNTLHDIAASLNRALESLGFPAYSDDAVSDLIGKSIDYMCKNAVPKGREGDWTAVRDAFFADYFDRLCDSTVPYPEMPELLETLQAHGYRLAVVTNKPDPHAKKLLKTLFPPEGAVFDRIQGQCPEFPTKPNPAMLDCVREELGFTREETLYLGDMDVDVQFAKNAGVRCVGCGWGYRGEAFLREAGADLVLSHPSELKNVLQIKD